MAALLPTIVAAQSIPPDSIQAWLTSYCDQRLQYHALSSMAEAKEPLSLNDRLMLYGVKDEYNTSSVRNAFNLFTRSITLVDCTASCDTVIYVFELSGKNIGHDSEPRLYRVLSIYLWWGLTSDLYDIGDSLFYPGYPDQDTYYSLLWNRMGIGYIKHVYDRVAADSAFFKAPEIASAYLSYCPAPLDTMTYWSKEILRKSALSTGSRMRFRTSECIIKPYLNGHQGLKASIDTLLNDTDTFISNYLWSSIRRYQDNYHLLNEFTAPAPAPSE